MAKRRIRLGGVRLILAAGIAVSGAAHGAPASVPLDFRQALAASQAVLGRQVGTYRLIDPQGAAVSTESWQGRPVVISPIYTSCDQVCAVTTRALARLVEVAREALGERHFAVATIGFDSRFDTPARMAAYARRQGIADPDWQFLSGDRETLAALMSDIGFTFAPSARGFDHLSQITVLDQRGQVYRQIYGDRFDPPSLVEPLKELIYGRPAAAAPALSRWLDGLRLLCTVYDPSSGRYRFDYSIFVGGAIGALCLGGIAVFLVRSWFDPGRSRQS